MPAVNRPQTTESILADLNRRLKILESAAQLGSSQINAGALTITDAAGNILVTAGQLPNGSYGLQVNSGPGGPGVMFLADANGVALPFVITPARDTSAGGAVATTSTTVTPLWRTEIELLEWDAVRVRVPWATGTAAGSLRIAAINGSVTTATATVALAASSSGTYDFRWLHGVTLGVGPIYFEVQAATSNAAQPVSVWGPDGGFTFYRGADMTPAATAPGI
jgi:hypothetical protein